MVAYITGLTNYPDVVSQPLEFTMSVDTVSIHADASTYMALVILFVIMAAGMMVAAHIRKSKA